MILSIITNRNHKEITKGFFMTKCLNFLEDEINILIVEDETILAIGMEASLYEFGYEVSGIETTAQGAIEHASDNLPDLILMDINLKGKSSGIEAAKRIWQYNKIPIIFLTSYCDDKSIKDAMQSEPYGYLIKPCRDEELKVAIKTALHKHKFFFANKDSLNISSPHKKIITIKNNFSFDKGKGILYYKKEPLKLTGNEVKLFEILTDCSSEVVSFNKISTYIWRETLYDMGKLRNLVYRLRNKIGEDLFENVYEVGYKLKVA